MYKSHFQRPCKHRIVYFCHLDIEEDEEYQNLKLKFTFFGGFPFHNIERILKRVKRLPKSIYRHCHTLHRHIQNETSQEMQMLYRSLSDPHCHDSSFTICQ